MTATDLEAGARAAVAAGAPWRWLRERVFAERERWALWLAVAFGAGVGIYFRLTDEPPLWLAGTAVVAVLGACIALRGQGAARVALLGLLMIAAGFAAGALRSDRVAAPVIERRIGPTSVEGRVLGVDTTASGRRLLIDHVAVTGLPAEQTPARLRISLRGAADLALVPGQRVRLRALLRPAGAPLAPGAFDFQRFLFFAGVGGTGTGFAPVVVLPSASGETLDAAIWIAQLRTITARVLAVLPGDTGAVAAALIAGDESKISTPMQYAYRDSGLAHLLSISGLHNAIVAGFVMYLVRAALALCPPIALRHLAFLPEALLNPSFQMSYASVIALIAGYEVAQPSITRWRARTGWWGFPVLYLGGLVFSSLLATAATAPFSAFTFNRIALFGLVANMVAVPLSGVLVMPAGLIGVLLMPFGGEAIGLVPMGWGIALINWVAVEIAGWPAAVIRVPAFPIDALAAIVLGALWVCLWRTPWRWWGFALVGAGCLAAALSRPPDLLVAPDGRLIAINPSAGHLMLSTLKGQRFTAQAWLNRFAEDQPAAFAADGNEVSCDRASCLYRTGRHIVALVSDARALAEDCRVATALISIVPVRGRCRSAERVIDRFDLWRQGAHAIWLGDDGVRVETVRDYRGVRPWAPAPEARHRVTAAASG